ncbi:MAG TPA: ATPase domain-containing protein [Blastocatellia bacterium]|nr:ATPase domain-containing protein [Blastocatellia bacterium]
MTEQLELNSQPVVRTGVEGLDVILRGGLIRDRIYLVEGDPGSGKTTLGLQFLLDGARQGERCMLVALSETAEELDAIAAEHGWSLEGMNVFELRASQESLNVDSRYTMFHPSEVELTETTKALLKEAERVKPVRLVFDSLSELRLLAQNPLRYRRQILALKEFLLSRQCTVLLLDDQGNGHADMHLRSMVHGVISLERRSPEYGSSRRRLQVIKVRGCAYSEGYHDFLIKRGGLEVFPRLVAAEHSTSFDRDAIESGLKSLDALLGGGLARSTSTLITGPAGSGKSSIAAQYAVTSAARRERAAIFVFDESIATLLERCAGLGFDVRPYVESGYLRLRQVDPAEMTPGQFSHVVRMEAEQNGVRLVVIDSLNGYLQSMPSEKLLTVHLHELLTYLGQKGVTTLLIMAQHGMVAASTEAPVDTSYLADAVILTRFFEASGEVRQAISVIKKRTGHHERTIRELRLSSRGVNIGEPLREFDGVLTGMPSYVGAPLRQASGDGEERSNTAR